MAAAPISSAPAAPPPARGEQATSRLKTKWQKYGTPALVILLALAIVFTITHNWNSWEGGRIEQITNDAYVRGDLTPLSTKVAGMVQEVKVGDYQQVRRGDVLVQLEDQDFKAQVAQATAAVEAAKAAIENNRRQRELQDSKIQRAVAGIDQANAQIAAAQAGKEGAGADGSRTRAGGGRQGALLKANSATQQKLEAAVDDAQRFAGQHGKCETEHVETGT